MFSLSEYLVVLSNMGFHFTGIFEFTVNPFVSTLHAQSDFYAFPNRAC